MRTTRKVRVAKYDVHDNGGRPFQVSVKPGEISVAVRHDGPDEPTTFYKSFETEHVWVGSDSTHGAKGRGNSILALLRNGKYIWIGHEIIEFSLAKGDEVVAFKSPIGPSDVPYPYIIGRTHTYLLAAKAMVPNDALAPKKHAYEQYYSGALAKSAKKLPAKVIHKRLYY